MSCESKDPKASPAICGGSSKFAGRDSRTEGDDLSTSSGESASKHMHATVSQHAAFITLNPNSTVDSV